MRRTAIVLILVGLVFLLPRVSGLSAYLNTDGAGFWFERSAKFWQGLAEPDLIKTVPAPHPGVTLTWLAGAGFRLADAFGLIGDIPSDANPLAKGDALSYGALPVALISAAFGVAAFRLLRRSTGSLHGGLFAIAFLAVDPWWISQGRQFHLDALAISFSFFGLLIFPLERSGRWRSRAIVGGIAFALGVLTRFSSVLVPAVLFFYLLGQRTGRSLFSKLRVWFWAGAAGAATVAILWPVAFIHPWATFVTLRRGVGWALHEHLDLPFTQDLPGWLQWSEDPFVLFTRLPLAVLAVLIAFLASRRWREWSHHERLLGLFGAVSFLFIWAAPKSIDRYLLPTVVALELLAGLAVFRLWQSFVRWRRFLLVGLVCVVGFGALEITRLHPYESFTRNSVYRVVYPHLVGKNLAFIMGWGEGLREATDYLNGLPGADTRLVASWYSDVTAAFYRGPVVPTHTAPYAEYVIVYQNQLARNVYPSVARAILDEGLEPELSIFINGYGTAWVYKTPDFIAKAKPPLEKTRRSRGNLSHEELLTLLNAKGRVHRDLTR